MSSKRLALGTVQFGLSYGIANQNGQVRPDEAAAIVRHAYAAGCDTLDTAIAYGESERQLGEIGVRDWQVISKLPPVPHACTDTAQWARDAVRSSLQRLRIGRLHGLLLHRSQELLAAHGDALSSALVALKDEGLVENIGVSIYVPDELDAIGSRMPLDMVQAPFSVFDRRLAASGWLQRLHTMGTKVHVRSIFLQGLLLMDAAARPARFGRWHDLWARWDRWLAQEALTPLQACLSFVLAEPGIDRIVVGVDSLKQLQQVIASMQTRAAAPPSDLCSEEPDLVNPSLWSMS